MTIFDWMKQVTYIRDPWHTFSDEDKESFNVYMLHKVISMHEPYIDLANYLQKLWLLTLASLIFIKDCLSLQDNFEKIYKFPL